MEIVRRAPEPCQHDFSMRIFCETGNHARNSGVVQGERIREESQCTIRSEIYTRADGTGPLFLPCPILIGLDHIRLILDRGGRVFCSGGLLLYQTQWFSLS